MIEKNTTTVLVYPKLPSKFDFSFIRVRGSGLANCLFVAAKCYILVDKYGWKHIEPTWHNLSLGPYLRGEKDKRHYANLFAKRGVSGVTKLYHLLCTSRLSLDGAFRGETGVLVIEGIETYFEDIRNNHKLVLEKIMDSIKPDVLSGVLKVNFRKVIGIHVRLGDYSLSRKTALEWYINLVSQIVLEYGDEYQFYVFSDGTEQELAEILSQPNTTKVFFGSAIADIIALSKCEFIIGSDSTFSAWGAYLGQVPIVFPKRHFSNVLVERKNELVSDADPSKTHFFLKKILDEIHIKYEEY